MEEFVEYESAWQGEDVPLETLKAFDPNKRCPCEKTYDTLEFMWHVWGTRLVETLARRLHVLTVHLGAYGWRTSSKNDVKYRTKGQAVAIFSNGTVITC